MGIIPVALQKETQLIPILLHFTSVLFQFVVSHHLLHITATALLHFSLITDREKDLIRDHHHHFTFTTSLILSTRVHPTHLSDTTKRENIMTLIAVPTRLRNSARMRDVPRTNTTGKDMMKNQDTLLI